MSKPKVKAEVFTADKAREYLTAVAGVAADAVAGLDDATAIEAAEKHSSDAGDAVKSEPTPAGLVRMKHDDPKASASFNGEALTPGKDGAILAPAAALVHLQGCGFKVA